MDRFRMLSPAGGRSRVRQAGWIAVAALLGVAVMAPASNASQDTGNNGTVKIHEGATETEPIVHNDPHVCTFHLHFFFADPAQAGTWEIQEWAPGDKGTVVLSGTYDTNGAGEDRQPEQGAYDLPDGHYKLFWDGDSAKHDKMKVFWVDCGQTTTTTSTTETGTMSGTSTTETGTVSGTSTTETSSTSSSNTQDVLGETGAPETSAPGGNVGQGPTVTLPPTDASVPASSAEANWRAFLVAMAALLAMVLVLTPARPAPQEHRPRA